MFKITCVMLFSLLLHVQNSYAVKKKTSYNTYYMEDYKSQTGKLDLRKGTERSFKIEPSRLDFTQYMRSNLEIVPPHRAGLLFTVHSNNLKTSGKDCVENLKIKGIRHENDEISICGFDKGLPKSFYAEVNSGDDIEVQFNRKLWKPSYGAPSPEQGFTLIVTAFFQQGEDRLCPTDHFACGSTSRCISQAFICDTYNNCGDLSDEQHCENSSGYEDYEPVPVGNILLIIAGVFVVLAALAVIIISCNKTKKKNPETSRIQATNSIVPPSSYINYTVPIEPPTAPPTYDANAFYQQPESSSGYPTNYQLGYQQPPVASSPSSNYQSGYQQNLLVPPDPNFRPPPYEERITKT